MLMLYVFFHTNVAVKVSVVIPLLLHVNIIKVDIFVGINFQGDFDFSFEQLLSNITVNQATLSPTSLSSVTPGRFACIMFVFQILETLSSVIAFY